MNEELLNKLHALFRSLAERAVTTFVDYKQDRLYILQVEDVLSKTDEMNELIDCLEESASETRQLLVLTQDEKFKLELAKVLSRLVFECLTTSDPIVLIEKNVKQVYQELDWSVSVEIPLGRFWAYLQQCEIDKQVIDLDGPLRMRKPTIFERAYFRSQGFTVGGRTEADVIVETMPSARTSKVEKSLKGLRFNVSGELLIEFEYLVTVLRLVHPSSVGINLIMHDESPAKQSVIMSFTHNTRPDIFPAAFGRRLNTKCQVNYTRRKLLIKLLRRLRKVVKLDDPEVPRLIRSLRRYNRAISNDFIEDELVDLFIILETIARVGSKPMASRISWIASTNKDEREQVEKTLNKCHRLRSNVVHGSSFDSKNTQYVDDLLIITCHALILYIVLIGSKEGVVDQIERVKGKRDLQKNFERKVANWILELK